MSKPRYYRRDGTPYKDDGLFAWAKDHNNSEIKQVASDYLPNGRHVSTVWVGLDLRLLGDGPPLIFETMVFNIEDEDPTDNNMARYSTEQQAIEGHKRMVQKWR